MTKPLSMRLRLGVATIAIAAGLPAMASAQEASTEQSYSIGEITVTARRKAEAMQDVPLAVTAMGAEELRNQLITDVSQVAAQVPSFTFQSQNALESEMFIRGVGSVRLNSATADPSIGTFLDEIYIGRRGAATPPIFDLERIEVLRGPQGTIFGKNVVGGAINMITAKPTQEFDAGGSVAIGNYSSILAEGFVSGPISEKVSARVAVTREQHDGYAHNPLRNEELEDVESTAVRGTLAWDISDTMRLTLTADASKTDSGGSARHAVDDPNAPGFGFITPNLPSQDPRTNFSPYEQYANRETSGLTARFEWDIGSMSLIYLAGLRNGEGNIRWTQAGAGSPPSITDSTLTQYEDYKGLTQELRLQSDPDKRLRWSTGVYYLREEVARQSRNTAKSFLPGGPGSTRDTLDGDNQYIASSETNSYGVFGEFEYDLTQSLTLAVGGRYTTDEKSLDSRAEILSLGLPGDLYSPAPLLEEYHITPSQDWSEFTPRVALEWKPNDDILVYGAYSTGYKGGGWQGAAPDATAARKAYDPETATSWELGVKADWLNGRLRTNLALFRTDFEDLQVELLDDVSMTLIVANAADALIQGAEFEVKGRVTPWLTLSASGSFIDAEYQEYTDPLRGISYDGHRIQRTPEFQYTLGADVDYPINDKLSFIASANYSYQDQMFWGPENTNSEDAYGQLNGRIGVASPDGRWSLTLWGRNITDELYRISVIPFAGDEVSLFGAPRTFGVRLGVRY
ncbi:hypothetical protein OB03_02325 [Brevundimonas sp. GN22]|uniref:TonB-dependent receptor n=1 Tax=Brevundimonas pishanensis TaxID=2896315 RepID=UPI001FA72EA4|nr:TonB-dependent receptor [Brevundimonas pishanensis]